MAHTLPELPFAKNALAPHISEETFEYHYGKHHQAYVTNLNNLIPGTEYENLSVEETFLKAPAGGIYNKRRPGLEPHLLLELPQAERRRWLLSARWLTPSTPSGVPSTSSKKAFQASAVGNFGSGWTWLVKKADGSVDIVNYRRRRQPAQERRRQAPADHRRVGTRLLHRLPQCPPQVRGNLPEQPGQPGTSLPPTSPDSEAAVSGQYIRSTSWRHRRPLRTADKALVFEGFVTFSTCYGPGMLKPAQPKQFALMANRSIANTTGASPLQDGRGFI